MILNRFPDKDQYLRLAEKYRVVPVCTQILADTLTPVSLLGRFYDGRGPIFLLDGVFGIAQARVREPGTRLLRIRVLTAAGFALTSLWMVVFTLQWFWLALAIIWGSLWCLLGAAWLASQTRHHRRGPWWQWLPLSLHAGWVSLAVFLNVAQVVVAFRLLSVEQMLPWTLVLFALAGLLLLAVVVKLRGNPWYALAAVWGLLGVHARQQASDLPGADMAANVALVLAVLVALTALVAGAMGWRERRKLRTG